MNIINKFQIYGTSAIATTEFFDVSISFSRIEGTGCEVLLGTEVVDVLLSAARKFMSSGGNTYLLHLFTFFIKVILRCRILVGSSGSKARRVVLFSRAYFFLSSFKTSAGASPKVHCKDIDCWKFNLPVHSSSSTSSSTKSWRPWLWFDNSPVCSPHSSKLYFVASRGDVNLRKNNLDDATLN